MVAAGAMAFAPAATFGLRFFAKLLSVDALAAAQAGAFVSPLSVYVALVLLLNGATPGSDTYVQIWNQLGVQGARPGFALSDLNTRLGRTRAALLRQANVNGDFVAVTSLWARQDVLIRQPYINDMRKFYGAQVGTASSADPINAWASKATRSQIEAAVPADTAFGMLLADAVTFLGSWQIPFDKSQTAKAAFSTRGQDGQSVDVEVDMMFTKLLNHEEVRTAERMTLTGLFEAVKLPYLNSSLSAIAVLPDLARFGLDVDRAAREINLARLLSKGRAKGWRPAYSGSKLWLPKFEIKVERLSLKQVLNAMGIVDAFDQDKALFSTMSGSPGVCPDDFLHSTVVKVEEVGPVLATYTDWPLEQPFFDDVRFDRPFIFMVVDETTGTALLVGTVKDPSQPAL